MKKETLFSSVLSYTSLCSRTSWFVSQTFFCYPEGILTKPLISKLKAIMTDFVYSDLKIKRLTSSLTSRAEHCSVTPRSLWGFHVTESALEANITNSCSVMFKDYPHLPVFESELMTASVHNHHFFKRLFFLELNDWFLLSINDKFF